LSQEAAVYPVADTRHADGCLAALRPGQRESLQTSCATAQLH
jgi:hypothetical protein